MIVLGISGGVKAGNQDPAAAILIDGRLIAAAEEERFTGVKFANGQLPRQAIRYCLSQAGIKIQDVDRVVFPGATYHGFADLLRRYFQFQFGHAPQVKLVDHHTAHAASTYFASGWDEALVFTFDFSGDGKSTTVRAARGGDFSLLEEIEKPNSLGIYYSAVTQFLGFQKDSDEYKVMGMAAYGQPRYDLSHILEVTETGYKFHHDFVLGLSKDTPAPSKQERLFERFPLEVAPRLPGSPFEQVHYDVAASAQRQLTLAVEQLVRHYVRRTGIRRVCFAGGVALNCLMNQTVREGEPVTHLYVPPVCSDAGLALGAAYLEAAAAGERIAPLPHAYWGPEYSHDEIRFVLDRAGVKYREVSDPVPPTVSALLEGKTVGWFQGRMEYGPRALGSRSILADPRVASMKDRINQRIKFREEFRPVAPSVLADRAAPYFEHYADSPYMTQTFTATPRALAEAPVTVHEDGTSRLQSVHAATNPLYYRLIEGFCRQSGVPMVVNTSLNAYNDPMACEPHQALRTFFATGLEFLALGNFVLEK